MSLAGHNGIFLSLGSNVGDRENFLNRARTSLLAEGIKIVGESSVHETAPWGNQEQAHFLNQCVQIATHESPENLLKKIKNIEQKIGRQEASKWGPREIDIDILFYNDMILHYASLTIPHPHIAERSFVLVPLCEIAPDFVHPVLKKSVKALLQKLQ